MKLEGIVKEGKGRANITIAKQKICFQQLGLKNVEKFKDGSINIDISPLKYEILNFDYFFENVEWDKDKTENFGFVTIEKIIYNNCKWKKPGYIYIPHNSPHFSNKSQFEVISIEIDDIMNDKGICLIIKEGKLKHYH
ncbi:MAG: hypothetical protein KKA79_09235 [Nanoarchaeota archaeon]|nr:hypothetical protein [Nanoarchaeota archaeon]